MAVNLLAEESKYCETVFDHVEQRTAFVKERRLKQLKKPAEKTIAEYLASIGKELPSAEDSFDTLQVEDVTDAPSTPSPSLPELSDVRLLPPACSC